MIGHHIREGFHESHESFQNFLSYRIFLQISTSILSDDADRRKFSSETVKTCRALPSWYDKIFYNCIMYFIEMFLEQWIMIAFQLKLLEWIIHKKMKFYKIFAASIFGSFSGCLILQLYDEDHGLKLGLMIISIVMTVKISCAFPMKKAWKYSVYLLVLSLFTGGIFTMIKGQIILPWLILATASCMLVRYLYVSAVKDMNHDKESFYQVEFTILHKKLEVCAFLDTGNFLYEPVSQIPVCILEEETFLKYFHEPLFKMIEKQEAEGIRMIPYQSVGREHGMMPAVMANDMKITKEDRIMEHKKAVIAISKVSLSKWGAYEMLLHPDLIKNGR